MRSALGTCFFTFATLLHSIESIPPLNSALAIINRLRHSPSLTSVNIAYYQRYFNGPLTCMYAMPEKGRFVRSHKVERNGLFIGLNVDDTIVPIFDLSEKMIVIRGTENILLRPEEAWIFPYYHPVNTDPDYPNHDLSSRILADVINRYRQARSLDTVSIGFYQEHFNGELRYVGNHWEFANQRKVLRNGFVIGLNVGDRLVPIFDENEKLIVIRDSENIELRPEDAGLLPYHHPIDEHPDRHYRPRSRH